MGKKFKDNFCKINKFRGKAKGILKIFNNSIASLLSNKRLEMSGYFRVEVVFMLHNSLSHIENLSNFAC